MGISAPAIIWLMLIPVLVVWSCLACVLYYDDDDATQIENELQKCIVSETLLALPEAVQILCSDPVYQEEISHEPGVLARVLLHSDILVDVINHNRQRRLEQQQRLSAHVD